MQAQMSISLVDLAQNLAFETLKHCSPSWDESTTKLMRGQVYMLDGWHVRLHVIISSLSYIHDGWINFTKNPWIIAIDIYTAFAYI